MRKPSSRLRKSERIRPASQPGEIRSHRVNHMSDLIKRKPRLRLLARESYASSLQHAAVLAVVAITVLIAIVPFVFAIINAAAPAAHP